MPQQTFMREVLCPLCPEDGVGPKVPMRFQQQRGPYDKWFDDKLKKTITQAMVGSRCIREFWICTKCNTVVWWDFLIDKPMNELPPEIREWMKEKFHVGG